MGAKKYFKAVSNYEFCANWVLRNNSRESDIRVLDYGCGTGEIVKILRHGNINAFGCDVYYEGGNRFELTNKKFFENGIIKKIKKDTIPFDDQYFDFVVNNQVMEHVEDLDHVLSEICRVLRPGGMILNLFPDRGVWREGHCGIPFLHWFPKRSVARIYYAAVLRLFGLGFHKNKMPVLQWSKGFCEWLDEWTHYKKRAQIHEIYRRHFEKIFHIEEIWLHERLGGKGKIFKILPTSLRRLFVNKLGGMVFFAVKRNSEAVGKATVKLKNSF